MFMAIAMLMIYPFAIYNSKAHSGYLVRRAINSVQSDPIYIVSTDEVSDPNNFSIRAFVNGEVRQDSNTSDMIYYCDGIISYISEHVMLYPADIILTGTPSGVIVGYPEEKRIWLGMKCPLRLRS
jgi:2-keto-4-pentenoate hydratase/2-oxohepta-3-ene-1,7-dioic acid hydratase in catechol pathway